MSQETFQEAVLKNAFVPDSIVIGVQHKKSKLFDDCEELHRIGGHSKINGISVFWDKHGVIGLELFYKIGKTAIGDFLKSTHNRPAKLEKSHGSLFEIGPDDYLLEINGTIKPNEKKASILTIGFVTYKGKKATFGVEGEIEGAEAFSHKFEKHTFGGFTGGHRDFLDFLRIPVVQAPNEFLLEFQPVHLNFNINNNHVLTAEIQRPIAGTGSAPGGGATQTTATTTSAAIANTNFMQITIPKIPTRSLTNPVTTTAQSQQQNQPQYQYPQYQQQQPQQQQQQQQQQQFTGFQQVQPIQQIKPYVPAANFPVFPIVGANTNNVQAQNNGNPYQYQNNNGNLYGNPNTNNFANPSPYAFNNTTTNNNNNNNNNNFSGSQPSDNNGGLSLSKYPTLKK